VKTGEVIGECLPRHRWLIPLTQVALDVVCREVGRVRSPGRTPDGQGALAFRIPEGIF